MDNKPTDKGEWVSVEILPDEHEKVLVCLDGGTILCGIMDSNNKWYVFYSDGRNEEHPDRRITHWMPLPSPPPPNSKT